MPSPVDHRSLPERIAAIINDPEIRNSGLMMRLKSIKAQKNTQTPPQDELAEIAGIRATLDELTASIATEVIPTQPAPTTAPTKKPATRTIKIQAEPPPKFTPAPQQSPTGKSPYKGRGNFQKPAKKSLYKRTILHPLITTFSMVSITFTAAGIFSMAAMNDDTLMGKVTSHVSKMYKSSKALRLLGKIPTDEQRGGLVNSLIGAVGRAVVTHKTTQKPPAPL